MFVPLRTAAKHFNVSRQTIVAWALRGEVEYITSHSFTTQQSTIPSGKIGNPFIEENYRSLGNRLIVYLTQYVLRLNLP
jgi:hypothetical protein